MYSIKPTYSCDDIKILKECPKLLLIIDVVLNIVMLYFAHLNIALLIC